jgi:hypothetical protein
MNCRSGGILAGRGPDRAQCQSLLSTIGQMERNLAKLERQRARLEGRSNGEKDRILAAIRANGCDASERQAKAEEPERRRISILDQIFDANARRRPPIEEAEREGRQRVLLGPGGGSLDGLFGSYRTICVRACDGYYFPISFSATPGEFDRDLQACQAMCPGTEVDLYFHRVPDEEVEEMVSIAGTPYRDLPNAFRYRRAGFVREPSCGCNPVRNFEIIAGEHGNSDADDPETVAPSIPVPTPRPDPAADPETLANREGKLARETIGALVRPRPAPTAAPDGERRVRVVGPAFLPDPEAGAGPQAPAPNPVR